MERSSSKISPRRIVCCGDAKTEGFVDARKTSQPLMRDGQAARSTITAIPWPPPIQAAATP